MRMTNGQPGESQKTFQFPHQKIALFDGGGERCNSPNSAEIRTPTPIACPPAHRSLLHFEDVSFMLLAVTAQGRFALGGLTVWQMSRTNDELGSN